MKSSTKIAFRVLACLGLFALLALPIVRVGDPRSPSQKKLDRCATRPRIVVVGDSRAHAGIDPRLLASELAGEGGLELSGYNFAEDGTDAVHHYQLIVSHLLNKPGPPSLFLWAPNPLSFDD